MQDHLSAITTGEEFFEFLRDGGKQQALRRACMSHEDQLREYLQRCNRRGSRYHPKIDSDPNLAQIAKYCECDLTTILRIANGETKAPSSRVVSIISAVAGISPPAFHCDPDAERRARLDDADRWVKSDARTRGGALEALMAGIAARIRASMN